MDLLQAVQIIEQTHVEDYDDIGVYNVTGICDRRPISKGNKTKYIEDLAWQVTPDADLNTRLEDIFPRA